MGIPFPDAPPNFLASAVLGQRLGKENRLDAIKQNALATVATDPDAAQKALLAAGDFQGAQAVGAYGDQQTQKKVLSAYGTDPTAAKAQAFASGDPTLIDAVSKLDANQRTTAQASAERLAAVGLKLKTMPYDQRKATLQTLAPALVASHNLTQEQIAAFDPTDENIDGIVGSAMDLHDVIAQQDKAAQLALQQQTLTETGRHNLAGERAAGIKVLKDSMGNEQAVDLGLGGGSGPSASPAPGDPTSPAPAGASLPRGLRNNNPLNVKASVPWNGMTGSDGGYAVFATPEAGWAAADHNLQAYATQHGINTIAGAVERWAPAGDGSNNPAAYAATVAKQVGVEPNTPINLHDPAVRQHVLEAMAGVENGRPVAFGSGAGAPVVTGSGGTDQLGGAAAQPPASGSPRVLYSTAGQGGAGAIDPTLTGPAVLQKLSQADQAMVKALSEGRKAIPGGFASKSPYWQRMIQLTAQFDPRFDETNYQTRLATRKAFQAGSPPSSPRGQLNSINTVVQHIATLNDAIDGLRNFSGMGASLNPLANAIAGRTDKNYQAARARYEAAAEAVSSDLPTVLRGTSAEGDVNHWRKVFDPDKPTVSLKEAARSVATELVQARLQPLVDQYQQGLGTSEDPFQALFPKAAAALAHLTAGGSSKPGAPGGPGKGQQVRTSSGAVVTVTPIN